MAQTPKYPLGTVLPLVDDCTFSATSKSTLAVITVKRIDGTYLTATQAEIWMREKLKTLVETDFHERIIQWGDTSCVADVYGKEIENEFWYIKFMIEDGCLDSISFHPTSKEMSLQSGEKIKEGSLIYDEEKTMWCMRKS